MTLKWQGYSVIGSEWEAYAEIISLSIQCFIIIILMIVYLKYFCCTKNKIDTSFNALLLLSLIFTFIYIFGTYIIHGIFALILGYRNEWICFIINLCGLGILGQRLTVYSFFLIRLYATFKRSFIEIKKGSIIIILILMVITISIPGISAVIFAYFADNASCPDGKYAYEWLQSLIIANFFDYVWSILLSYMYINKLRKLIKKINSSNETMDNKLLNIANKLALLALVSVVSTMILAVLAYGVGVFSHSLICLDLIINNACLMFSFAVLDKSYKKYCCCCIRIQNLCCCLKISKDRKEILTQTKTSHHIIAVDDE